MMGLVKKEAGPTAVECAITLALLVAVCVTAIGRLGNQDHASYSVTNSRPNATAR
jgi:hypothetical protein